MNNNESTKNQNKSHNNILHSRIFFLIMIKYLALIKMILKILKITIFNSTSNNLKYYTLKTFKELKK
jgi:hypothetical protein